jgi:hypothetical protein
MVADSLLNQLENCNCFVQGFVNDVVILISGKFLGNIWDLLQRALHCVQNWCDEIEQDVNADKIWYFYKMEEFGGFFHPKLFDMKLILNNQVKYLRVILDIKLNWKFQIDNRIRKAIIVYWPLCLNTNIPKKKFRLIYTMEILLGTNEKCTPME